MMTTTLTCALHFAILLALRVALAEAAFTYTLAVEYLVNQTVVAENKVTFDQVIGTNRLLTDVLMKQDEYNTALTSWNNEPGHSDGAQPTLGLYFKNPRHVNEPLAGWKGVWQQVNNYLTEQEKHEVRPDSEAGSEPVDVMLKAEPQSNEGLALVVDFDDTCRVWTYFIINKNHSMHTKLTIDREETVHKLLTEEVPQDETFKKALEEWKKKNPEAKELNLNLYARNMEKGVNSPRLYDGESVFDQAKTFLGSNCPLTTCKGLAHNGHAALVVALGPVSDSSLTGNSTRRRRKNLPIAEPNHLTVDDLKSYSLY